MDKTKISITVMTMCWVWSVAGYFFSEGHILLTMFFIVLGILCQSELMNKIFPEDGLDNEDQK